MSAVEAGAGRKSGEQFTEISARQGGEGTPYPIGGEPVGLGSLLPESLIDKADGKFRYNR